MVVAVVERSRTVYLICLIKAYPHGHLHVLML